MKCLQPTLKVEVIRLSPGSFLAAESVLEKWTEFERGEIQISTRSSYVLYVEIIVFKSKYQQGQKLQSLHKNNSGIKVVKILIIYCIVGASGCNSLE